MDDPVGKRHAPDCTLYPIIMTGDRALADVVSRQGV